MWATKYDQATRCASCSCGLWSLVGVSYVDYATASVKHLEAHARVERMQRERRRQAERRQHELYLEAVRAEHRDDGSVSVAYVDFGQGPQRYSVAAEAEAILAGGA